MFGRAFLHAAFFSVNLEQNVTYLAQAPGSDMGQSAVRGAAAGRRSLQTHPNEEFEKPWRSSWTILLEQGSSSHSDSLREPETSSERGG